MRLLQYTATAALVAAGLALGASSSAQAAPAAASAASSRALSTSSEIVQVRDHRRGEYRRRGGDWDGGGRRYRRGYNDDYGWNPGAYIGLGIAGALIGGALSEGGDDDGPGYTEGGSYGGGASGAMQRCASTFRSFEWDTGLYTTYQGDKRLCPYLG